MPTATRNKLRCGVPTWLFQELHYICNGLKKQKKGTEAFPSFFNMAVQHSHPELEKLIDEQLAGYTDVFLVSIKIKPTNNIKVYLDADQGLSIDTCVKINRALYKQIEERAWYPEGDFSLEVSSPGIDEPLRLTRQFQKNVGRPVEVILLDESKQEGDLLAVTEEQITIRVTSGKGKKAVTQDVDIPRENIKQTKVLIRF